MAKTKIPDRQAWPQQHVISHQNTKADAGGESCTALIVAALGILLLILLFRLNSLSKFTLESHQSASLTLIAFTSFTSQSR